MEGSCELLGPLRWHRGLVPVMQTWEVANLEVLAVAPAMAAVDKFVRQALVSARHFGAHSVA